MAIGFEERTSLSHRRELGRNDPTDEWWRFLLGGNPQQNTNEKTNRGDEGKRKIRFDDELIIVTIPSHTSYTKSTKKLMWSSTAEIMKNAKRNRREFASEGWKWENAVEEDDMYLDKFSNEFIHPVHLGGIMDLQR